VLFAKGDGYGHLRKKLGGANFTRFTEYVLKEAANQTCTATSACASDVHWRPYHARFV